MRRHGSDPWNLDFGADLGAEEPSMRHFVDRYCRIRAFTTGPNRIRTSRTPRKPAAPTAAPVALGKARPPTLHGPRPRPHPHPHPPKQKQKQKPQVTASES